MRIPMIRLRRGGKQDGQGVVEFAMVLPVFALVLFGVVDVGRLVYVNSALSQAVREGARVAAAEASWIGRTGGSCVATESAIGPANPGAHVCPPSLADFKANIIAGVNRMAVSVGPLNDVYISCAADPDSVPTGAWTEAPGGGGNGCDDGAGISIAGSGDLVSVRATHTYQPLTPIISSLIGSIELSGSATMAIN